MATILLLNGPNLNLLGKREPGHYGSVGLDDIVSRLTETCDSAGHQLLHLQSNAEYQIIERIHQCLDQHVDFILMNPAAFTHTSVAIRDALLAVNIPFIELHMSNIHQREPFRHHSYFNDIAVGIVCGFKERSYDLALQAAFDYLETPPTTQN